MKKKGKYIFILILFVIAVAAIPLFLNNLDFTGTDDAAGETVAAMDPDYVPWARPVLELSDGKTEALLFGLQAGIGAGVLGLGFGYLILRKKKQ